MDTTRICTLIKILVCQNNHTLKLSMVIASSQLVIEPLETFYVEVISGAAINFGKSRPSQQFRHLKGCEIPDQLLSFRKGLYFLSYNLLKALFIELKIR